MAIALQMILCIATIVAQATFSPWLSLNSVYPDLCLLLACLAGFLSHEYKGLLIGLTVGLLQDLLTPGGIGLNMILKGLAGFLAGMTTHAVSTVTSGAVAIVTLVISLGAGLVSLIVTYPTLVSTEAFQLVTRMLIPQAVYHSVLAAGVFWLAHKIQHSFGVIHFSQGRR